MNTTSYQEIVDAVAEKVKTVEPGEWITGRGWHQSKWDSMPAETVKGFQTHDLLSEVSPDNPVYLRHASGHARICQCEGHGDFRHPDPFQGRGKQLRN